MKAFARLLKRIFVVALVLASGACGSELAGGSSAATPLLVRVDPETARKGSSVIVYGSFFSEEEDNVILVGGVAVVNTDWDIATTGNDGESEQIAFTLPQEATTGTQELVVMIGSTTSNTLSITVEE